MAVTALHPFIIWSLNAEFMFGINALTLYIYIYGEILTGALRALVKNPIKKSFDITFMGNEKNCQNINCFFFLFP